MPSPRSTDTPAIELTGLERHYGERVALADVSLTLDPGATLLVLGPNGAGKSTLLRVLATLLRPHAGSVRVLGRDLPREGWAVRGRIGYVGHDPLLYRDLSARENLLLHARLHGVAEAPGGRAAGCRRAGAAGGRPAAHVLARNGAARGGGPRGAARSGAACCSTSRARTSTRARPSSSSRCSRAGRGSRPATTRARAESADVVLALRDGRPHAMEGLYA